MEVRSVKITTNWTPREDEALDRTAQVRGVSKAELIREAVLPLLHHGVSRELIRAYTSAQELPLFVSSRDGRVRFGAGALDEGQATGATVGRILQQPHSVEFMDPSVQGAMSMWPAAEADRVLNWAAVFAKWVRADLMNGSPTAALRVLPVPSFGLTGTMLAIGNSPAFEVMHVLLAGAEIPHVRYLPGSAPHATAYAFAVPERVWPRAT